MPYGEIKRGLNDEVISERNLPCGVNNQFKSNANTSCGCASDKDKNINLVVNVNSNNSKDTKTESPVVANTPVILAENQDELRTKRMTIPSDNSTIRTVRITNTKDGVNRIKCAETFSPEFI